ncbi:unnamed protein product, partial [Linum tenue]
QISSSLFFLSLSLFFLSSKHFFPDLDLFPSLVIHFFLQSTKKKIAASPLKFGDAPNPSYLDLLLPSGLSFLGIKIDDAPY